MNAVRVFFGMILTPGEAMKRVVEKPRTWILAAVLLVASMASMVVVSAPYAVEVANEQAAKIVEQMADNIPEDQMDAVRERSQTNTQKYILTALGAGAVMAALGWAIRGAILHFSSMAMGGKSTWGPTFAVGVWSMIPYFFRDLLQIVYVAASKQIMQHSGLAFLVASGDTLADGRNLAYAALSNVDPFALWHLIVLAAGLAVATQMSKGKAAVLAVLTWAVLLGLKMVPSLLSMLVMGGL